MSKTDRGAPLFRRTALSLAVVCAFPAVSLLADTPLGDEFGVNSTINKNDRYPDVAMDGTGNFVAVWNTTVDQDGSQFGVFAQRFTAAGAVQGSEFQVNSYTANNQQLPAVAMSAAGGFVVTWESFNQPGDANSYGVFAQRYDAAGMPQGGEFQVNTYTANGQSASDVAMDADGDFVVVWQSFGQEGPPATGVSVYGVYARRYNAAGTAQSTEVRVNTTITNSQGLPSVAMDSDGDFVVVWQSYAQDGSNLGIYGQRFTAAGAPLGGEFQVNTYITGAQMRPAVAMDSDGDFVAVWDSRGQDGSLEGVYARRFNSAGTAQGAEFAVNSFTTGEQLRPSVAMDANGGFVVAWESYDQDDSFTYNIYARRYDPAGVAQGAEFLVGTDNDNHQGAPAVALDPDGELLVTWESYHFGSSYDIFAQRFTNACAPGVLKLSAATASVSEAVTSGKKTFTIARSGGVCGAVSVDYQTVDGTAKAGADYTAVTGTRTWADGVGGNKTFSVNLTNDALDEDSETFKVKILNPVGGAMLGTPKLSTVTITDNDPLPTVSFALASGTVVEGVARNVFLSLSAASGRTVTVPITRSGTATYNTDYTLPTTTVTFTPGQTSKSVRVTTVQDSAVEGNETVVLNLGTPTNAATGAVIQHTLTINDDDD